MSEGRRTTRKDKDEQSVLKLVDIEKLIDQSLKKALTAFQMDIEKFIDKRLSAIEQKLAFFETRCADMEKSIEACDENVKSVEEGTTKLEGGNNCEALSNDIHSMNQGRLSPLEWWKPTPSPDAPRKGSWHDIHALYLSQVGVSEREEMIKAPIIIQGSKPPSINSGMVRCRQTL